VLVQEQPHPHWSGSEEVSLVQKLAIVAAARSEARLLHRLGLWSRFLVALRWLT
jgi:hypothetical protein